MLRSPYDFGGVKIVWVKAGSTCIDCNYLLALLSHDKHMQPVKHLQPSRYYVCVLQGEEYSRKARRRQSEFSFARQGDVFVAPPGKACRRAGPAQRCARAGARGDDYSEGMEVEEEDEDGESGADSSSESVKSSDTSSSSSSDSATSSSSSSSDSNSHSASAWAHVDAQVADDGVGNPQGHEESMEQKGCESSDGAEHVDVKTGTLVWNGFKFCERYTQGSHTGWEATCYVAKHYNSANMCRRRRNITKDGDQSLCFRKLKYWCVQAFDEVVDGRSAHFNDVKDPPAAELLALHELDALRVKVTKAGVLRYRRTT